MGKNTLFYVISNVNGRGDGCFLRAKTKKEAWEVYMGGRAVGDYDKEDQGDFAQMRSEMREIDEERARPSSAYGLTLCVVKKMFDYNAGVNKIIFPTINLTNEEIEGIAVMHKLIPESEYNEMQKTGIIKLREDAEKYHELLEKVKNLLR